MTKQGFLRALREKLSDLPKEELDGRIGFYSEMIDDRMEEGRTEDEAVMDIGSVDGVAAQIMAESGPVQNEKQESRPKRRLRFWVILLLVLGAPVWLSLVIAAASAIVSFYVSLCSVLIALWSVWCSLSACAVGGVISGILMTIDGNGLMGMVTVGAGIFCAGLAILWFFGCKTLTKGFVRLSVRCVKKCFVKKENAS